jgi:hypothetical protein
MMDLVQKAFNKAQELLSDPFCLKKPMTATPEIVESVEIFKKNGIDRNQLTSKAIIGQGQVSA